MKRYVVYPGEIRSKNDGQIHYIGFTQLVELYCVPPGECIDGSIEREVAGRDISSLIKIHPRYDGDYPIFKIQQNSIQDISTIYPNTMNKVTKQYTVKKRKDKLVVSFSDEMITEFRRCLQPDAVAMCVIKCMAHIQDVSKGNGNEEVTVTIVKTQTETIRNIISRAGVHDEGIQKHKVIGDIVDAFIDGYYMESNCEYINLHDKLKMAIHFFYWVERAIEDLS
jgi:hypothetical protein